MIERFKQSLAIWMCLVLHIDGVLSRPTAIDNDDREGDCGKEWETRPAAFSEFKMASDYAAHVASSVHKMEYFDVTIRVLNGSLKDCRYPRYKLTAVFAESVCRTDWSAEMLDKTPCVPKVGKHTKTCQVYIWVPPGKGGKLETYDCVENDEVVVETPKTKHKQDKSETTKSKQQETTTPVVTTKTTKEAETTMKPTEKRADQKSTIATVKLPTVTSTQETHQRHVQDSWSHHVPLNHHVAGASTSVSMVAAACVIPVAGFAIYTYNILRRG